MTYSEAYEICRQKTKLHMAKLDGALFEPRESVSGDYYENYPNFDFVSYRWLWLTSMITGLAPLIFETHGDIDALKWSNRFKKEYHDKVYAPFTQTMHDIGFLYLPYSVHLWQLTGDTEHRDTALKAADELAKRFRIKGSYIDAWNPLNEIKENGRMIVDSSMNVSLLYWAWKETGHIFYRDVADAHLETIIKTLVRDDYSVAHAWFFDPVTGEKLDEANNCGYENGSYWARGTAWLVYGLAIAYSYTKNEYFLEIATKVGEKYLDSLGDCPVPVWDFRLPKDKPARTFGTDKNWSKPHWDETKKENMIYNVDTSAASIMACSFLLLNNFGSNERFAKYADDTLLYLSSNYLNRDLTIPAMLSRSNGRDVYSTYGDYYFMFALAMKLYGITAPWGNTKQN